MNVLIVYAHPEPRSFNGAADFIGSRSDPETFSLPREQAHAHDMGTLAPDIAAKQDKLRQAELFILRFPIWWFGMPAVMKGWADRVFTRGFAYASGRKYDCGLLLGKLAMVAATTGTSADTYAPDGIDGDILSVLWPIYNGLLRYAGFDVLQPFYRLHAGANWTSRKRSLSGRLSRTN